MSNRFVDNVTPLNAATLNQFEEALGASLAVSGDTFQLKNTDGAVKSSVTLPSATQSVRGGIKVWVSGTTLNISTT